jgi:hypothetical protein
MLTNKTRVLLILPQDVLDGAVVEVEAEAHQTTLG